VDKIRRKSCRRGTKLYYISICYWDFFTFFSNHLIAQIPQTISYQGVLKKNDGTLVDDGSYNMKFALYSTNSGGTAL